MTLLIWTGAIFLLMFAVAPYVPKSILATDLPSHFILQCAIGAAVLLALAVWLRVTERSLYITLLLVYALCIVQMWPYLMTVKAQDGAGATLKILQANVWVKNTNPEKMKSLIAGANPDIVVAAEVNTSFAAMFEALPAYPHRRIIAKDHSSFGIAVLSKIPLEAIETKYLADADIPSLFFKIRAGGKMVDVAALHAANPLYAFEKRDEEFNALAAWAEQAKPENLVVLGDLNATPYCPAFKKMVQRMNLKDARAGRGFFGTYPASAPVSFLRLPIDHVLVAGTPAFVEFRLGPDIGSDHLPTLTVIRL